jgi:hypothetical protein
MRMREDLVGVVFNETRCDNKSMHQRRTRTITMSTGTYTVNCDGTGTLHRMQTNVTTGVTSTNESDIVITRAVVKDGQFIATALVSAQTTPSTIVPGGVFTNMVYTRLPDVPAATPSSTGTRPSK